MKRLVVIVFGLLVASWVKAATIRVPADYSTIQAGINAAQAGDVVLVAPGTYHDCTHQVEGSPTLHCVIMKSGVSLISQSGSEVTTIDAENQGRVILVDYCTAVRVEGFTITGGYTGNPHYGAGLRLYYSTAEIVNNIITGNKTGGNGGGVYVYRGANTVVGNKISDNQANTYFGGGLYCISSESSFVDCQFIDNTAKYGGGIVCDFQWWHPSFSRCLIARNSASQNGGGIWASNSTKPLFEQCTIVGNSSPNGASYFSTGSPRSVFRCCVMAFGTGRAMVCNANDTFECCDIYGHTGGDEIQGTDLGGNFSLDPQFWDLLAGNYNLSASSPCLPGNHPSGCNDQLIGAFPADPSPVERHSWGSIKAMYR